MFASQTGIHAAASSDCSLCGVTSPRPLKSAFLLICSQSGALRAFLVSMVHIHIYTYFAYRQVVAIRTAVPVVWVLQSRCMRVYCFRIFMPHVGVRMF